MICPSCGLGNPGDSRVCAACGASLPSIVPPVATAGAMAALPLAPFAVSQVDATIADDVFEPVRTVPGPVDRESFFAAQLRHRRQTWRLVAACALAAIVTGIPLSLVLTPLIFTVILIVTRLVHIVTPVPDAVWNAYEWVGLVLVKAIEAADNSSTTTGGNPDLSNIPLDTALSLAAIWLIPGILLMLVLWPALIVLFRHAGVGGALLSLGAREPRRYDQEEQQLVNAIEEMAIAAGLPTPGVMLIDAPVANAAVVGTSPKDAVIVVTRTLLDDLDRDQTQGILAHLIASIGNGDLRAALSVIAIFQTFGFVSSVIRFPIDSKARRTVWRVLRYAFSRHRPGLRDQNAQAVSDLLTSGIDDFGENDDLQKVADAKPPQQRRGPKLVLLLYLPGIMLALYLGLSFLGAWSQAGRFAVLGLIFATIALIWYQRVFAVWLVDHSFAWFRSMLLLPYYLGTMMPLLMLMMLKSFLLEPLIGWLWRTRRYLADATAVQLTRNPDGLAGGLVEMVRHGGVIPGGAWATPLFVVGSETANIRTISTYQARSGEMIQEQLDELDPEGDDTGIRRMINEARVVSRFGKNRPRGMVQQLQEDHYGSGGDQSGSTGGYMSGSTASLHPGVRQRLQKLHALGATIELEDPATRLKSPFRSKVPTVIFFLILAPLWLIVLALGIAVLVILTGITLFVTAVMLLLVYGLFQFIAPV